MRQAWLKRGGKSVAERSSEEALRILATHKPLPLDPEVKARLQETLRSAGSR